MHPTYKRMLEGLEKKRKTSRGKKKAADKWSLYILKCRDGSFYTGITNNLDRRLKMHQDGKASRYTRTRGPVEMLYSETCGDRSSALIRECEVKEWPRTKKAALITRKRSKRDSSLGTRDSKKQETKTSPVFNSADLRVSVLMHRSVSKDSPAQGLLLQAGSSQNSGNRSTV